MGINQSRPACEADDEAQVLAIVEALRSYCVARGHEGQSWDEVVRRWYQEQLLRPSREQVDRALRLMRKTHGGDQRAVAPTSRGD